MGKRGAEKARSSDETLTKIEIKLSIHTGQSVFGDT